MYAVTSQGTELKMVSILQFSRHRFDIWQVSFGAHIKKFEDYMLFLLMTDAKQQNTNIRQFDKVFYVHFYTLVHLLGSGFSQNTNVAGRW